MAALINIVFMLGVITLLFLSPACMSIGLVRMSDRDFYISGSEKALCCIPIVNQFFSWNRYSGSKFSLTGISYLFVLVTFIVRMYVMYFQYSNESLQTITILIFLAVCLLFWLIHAFTIWSVLSDSGVYSTGRKIVCALTVVIGQIVVGYYLPRQMHYYSKNKKKGDLYGWNKE